MENKKITTHQLYTINATISLGGSILVIASTVASIVKQDAWISPLVATAFGILVMLMYYYLGSRYPGLTLIGISKKILGKWIGFAVSFCYVIMFLTTAAEVPWYIGSYFSRVMRETPVYVINLIFIAGIVIAMFYGIESIARASEVLFYFVTAVFTVFIILLFKNIKIEYITPMLENGVSPVFKGAYFLSCYITFSAINILMIYPRYISDISKAKKALIKGQLWSGAISFFTILMTILILGSALTARSGFPALRLAAEINVGVAFSRLEYIISLIWIATHFMIGLLFFFSTVTSLSELIGLKENKKIVLPMGLIIFILTMVVFPNAIYQGNWDNMVYTPLITTFGLIIPFVMMVVYFVKKQLFNIH